MPAGDLIETSHRVDPGWLLTVLPAPRLHVQWSQANHLAGTALDQKVASSGGERDGGPTVVRDVVFISKATPGDDEFVLWLAPRLEAAGYRVFADILSLEGGTRARKELTSTLQTRSIKMLLCCCDATLSRDGVQEEIGIAAEVAKELGDAKFIIPLRLEPYKKLFGIGELQWVDFKRGWAEGLAKLLDVLKRQKVPRDTSIEINPNWEAFRRRGGIAIKDEAERLTSNWLRVQEIPDSIFYFEATGALERPALKEGCQNAPFPVELHHQGFLSFATAEEINEAFAGIGKFAVKAEIATLSFVEEGLAQTGLSRQAASNIVVSILRQAWNRLCRERGLLEYRYAGSYGFHASSQQARIGQFFTWGRQGEKRSSMLRNVIRGHVWQFGVTALPAFWPFWHLRLKSRVLFAPLQGEEAGEPYSDAMKMHRLRRSLCKGWRNKQWHGRLMAFLEMMSGDTAVIILPLSPSRVIRLDASLMLFASPVSTQSRDRMRDEDEEDDESTLGRQELEEQ